MRPAASYLVYAAVLVRAANWYDENPPVRGIMLALLAIYGVILMTEPLFSRRFPRYPFVYLPVQTSLVLALMLKTPGMDFIPMLFIPLSFLAVRAFKRLGMIWIGVFIMVMSVPLLSGWDWELSGVAVVLIYAGINFMMGGMAYSMEKAELARQESQRLLVDLRSAYRKLQDYAAQVEEYAVTQERGRLRRELHDSVTQTLFSMNLSVQAAQMLAGGEPERVCEQLDRLQALAHGAAAEIQMLVQQPHRREELEGGLAAALKRLTHERQQRDGLSVRLELSGSGEESALTEPVKAGLYRIAQEALNNVAKHAGICEAVVRLDLSSQPAFLEIEDRGAGFDPELIETGADHIGLPGMAERSRELGWKLKIQSHPGRGTTIRVEEA